MPLSSFNRRFHAAGNRIFDLVDSDISTTLLESVAASSSRFCIVNPSIVQPVGGEFGKQNLKKAHASINMLAPLAQVVDDAAWVHGWPGTVLSSRRCLMLCGCIDGRMQSLVRATQTIYWRAPGHWEDLMLFVGNAIRFYVCSHERTGAIFGDQRFFDGLGIRSRSLASTESNWTICGHAIEQSVLNTLICSKTDARG